jgi:hypothetical protein
MPAKIVRFGQESREKPNPEKWETEIAVQLAIVSR